MSCHILDNMDILSSTPSFPQAKWESTTAREECIHPIQLPADTLHYSLIIAQKKDEKGRPLRPVQSPFQALVVAVREITEHVVVIVSQRQGLVEAPVDHHLQIGRILRVQHYLEKGDIEVVHYIGADKVAEGGQRGPDTSVTFKRGLEILCIMREIGIGGPGSHSDKVDLRLEPRDGLDDILGDPVRSVAQTGAVRENDDGRVAVGDDVDVASVSRDIPLVAVEEKGR